MGFAKYFMALSIESLYEYIIYSTLIMYIDIISFALLVLGNITGVILWVKEYKMSVNILRPAWIKDDIEWLDNSFLYNEGDDNTTR